MITTYGYDLLGRPAWVRDALGREDATHYTATGQLDWTARNLTPAQLDGQGQPILHAFDPATPDANVATLYGYDGLGRTAFVTETGILTGTFTPATRTFSAATTRVTRTTFDTLGRPYGVWQNYRPDLLATLLPDTNLYTETDYDSAGNLILELTLRQGWTFTFYDALNRPTRTRASENGYLLPGATDQLVQTATAYDAAGRVARQIDNYADGVFSATEPITDRLTLYQYDSLGRATATTLNDDPATLTTRTDTNRTSASAYDPATGRVLGQQDPLGRWTSYSYDVLGRVTATIQNCRDAAGNAVATGCAAFTAGTPDRNLPTTTHYDALGRAFETVDALGHVTHITYDGLARAVATTQNYAAGAPTTAITNVTTLTAYDAIGETTVITDALGAVRRTSYDALGQVATTTDAAGRLTRAGYDATGSLRWTQRPDGKFSVTQVDGMGRLVATIGNYQDGIVGVGEPADQDLIAGTSYDTLGHVATTTDPAGQVTQLSSDALDRLRSVSENAVSGSCTAPPCNVVTQYQYDPAGNRIALVDALGHLRRFSYDAANQQVSATDALGRTTNWEYDRSGRMTTQRDPRGSANDLSYSYDALDRPTQTSATNLGTLGATYDALGQRLSLSDGSGTTSFHYDALGRITQVQAPQTGTVRYSYDARGQRTQLIYPDATTLDYRYQLDGRLQQLKQGTTVLASYSYADALGRLTSLARANGATTTYSYDNVDRL
ncbi:MAG TPA: hypothetical protein VGJ87_00595, partial [Roseiflexaceae bacterium]